MKRVFFLLLMYFPVFAQDYKIPPDAIKSLIDADPQPTISFNEHGSLGLVLRRDGYQSIEDLAKDELRIAGTRLDPVRYTSSRMRYYKSFSLLNTKNGKESIVNYPSNGKFSFFQWSPDEKKIAYTNTTSYGVELWILDVDKRESYKVTDRYINDILNSPFQWFNSSKHLLVTFKCSSKRP